MVEESIRHQLWILARRPTARTTDFSRHRPTDWRPGQVRNPLGSLDGYFSEDAAWDFIATMLEQGHEVEEVELRKPPGKTGYVMKIELEVSTPGAGSRTRKEHDRRGRACPVPRTTRRRSRCGRPQGSPLRVFQRYSTGCGFVPCEFPPRPRATDAQETRRVPLPHRVCCARPEPRGRSTQWCVSPECESGPDRDRH